MELDKEQKQKMSWIVSILHLFNIASGGSSYLSKQVYTFINTEIHNMSPSEVITRIGYLKGRCNQGAMDIVGICYEPKGYSELDIDVLHILFLNYVLDYVYDLIKGRRRVVCRNNFFRCIHHESRYYLENYKNRDVRRSVIVSQLQHLFHMTDCMGQV